MPYDSRITLPRRRPGAHLVGHRPDRSHGAGGACSDSTGGRVFNADNSEGGLVRTFESIAEELRRQYSIGYIPETAGQTGQRKNIKVRVDRPNLVIRARDSYIVGEQNKPQPKIPAKTK